MRTTIFSEKGYGFQVMPIINSMMIKEARDKARKTQPIFEESDDKIISALRNSESFEEYAKWAEQYGISNDEAGEQWSEFWPTQI